MLRFSRPQLVSLGLVALLAAGGLTEAASADGNGPPAAAATTENGQTPPAAAPAPGAESADSDVEPDPLWPVAPPTKARGATVAQLVVATNARLRLTSAARTTRVVTQTAWSHQSQALLVLGSAERQGVRWVKVLLGTRPNGRTAWIRRDHVLLSSSRYWITVATRKRRVTVYRNGRRVRSFRAVVGAPRTPTPRTLSAVYEVNRQPHPQAFLGPWVIALTAHSNVLENYGGGPGRVAIHGRAGVSLLDPLGSARSHGCVRVNNPDASFLARHVPVGTPVDLRR